MSKSKGIVKSFELRDVILMAGFGILFAIIYLAVFNVGMGISAALTTTGLGDFAFDIIYGVWFMAGTMAAYIIRKPGAGLIAEVLGFGCGTFNGKFWWYHSCIDRYHPRIGNGSWFCSVPL